MPETNQIFFSHKETLEALVKHAGIHEGRWTITITFGLGAGVFGPTPNEGVPGAVVGVQKIGLERAGPEIPDERCVYAAVVNPAPKTADKLASS